jgi:hypothetical protein
MAILAGALAVLAASGLLAVWTRGGTPPGPTGEIDSAAGCRFFKVAADALNLFKEPRGASDFVGRVGKNDIVCAAPDRQVGDLVWTYVAYKLEPRNQREAMEGWAVKRSLSPATAGELAALRGSQSIEQGQGEQGQGEQGQGAPPPPEAPAPAAASAADIVRFSEPIGFGPPPVNGHSLEELIAGVPIFPPLEGLDENAWKRTCASCHKWDRQTLCAQGAIYVKNPNVTIRIPHPYGGAEKIAMMKWAESGCQ